MLFLPSADFFNFFFFFKKLFQEHFQSDHLDPDQDRHFVGPDLGPNCLHRLSADDNSSQLSDYLKYQFLKPAHMRRKKSLVSSYTLPTLNILGA